MIVAQISDLHIRAKGQLAYRRVDTATYLERPVAARALEAVHGADEVGHESAGRREVDVARTSDLGNPSVAHDHDAVA